MECVLEVLPFFWPFLSLRTRRLPMTMPEEQPIRGHYIQALLEPQRKPIRFPEEDVRRVSDDIRRQRAKEQVEDPDSKYLG